MGIEAIQNDYFVNPFMGLNNYNVSLPTTASSPLFGFGFNDFPLFPSFNTPIMPIFNSTPSFSNFFSGIGSVLSGIGSVIKSAGSKFVNGAKKVYNSGKQFVKTICEKGKKLLQNVEFMIKAAAVALKTGCKLKDLLAVMRAESGLNPAAVNKHGGASGLIQFMPKTARGLGTTVEAIRNMSAVQQLDYVEKFLLRARKSAGFRKGERLSGGQLYSLIFLPARARRNVLTVKGEAAYDWNSKTDLNGDGKITRDEMDARVRRYRVDSFIPKKFLA